MSDIERYRQLAQKLLERELKYSPLELPEWDNQANEIVAPRDNVGDLTDGDDQRLAILCDRSSDEWAGLNIERRIPYMEVATRRDDDNPEPEWSEAKTPATWRKELGIGATTLREWRKNSTLIVDAITTKSWRIRLDSLRRIKGRE